MAPKSVRSGLVLTSTTFHGSVTSLFQQPSIQLGKITLIWLISIATWVIILIIPQIILFVDWLPVFGRFDAFKDDYTGKIVLNYYTLSKTFNCPGNNTYAVLSAAFESTYLLASGSSDNTAKLWDNNSGQLRSLTGHADPFCVVAFDSSNMLASGSNDKTIKLWEKKTGGRLRTLIGFILLIRTVAFKSSHLLVSGSDDKTIKIWNKN